MADAAPAPTKRTFGGGGDKCDICEKAVYATEKISADGKNFHKTCLKCEKCKSILSLGSYAAAHGKYYCKPHYTELFKLNGNYDSGFGEQELKKKFQAKKEAGSQ